MDATQIKTRHGLILQGVTAHALKEAGFSHRENWQYDADTEVPDFFVPDSDEPEYIFEVQQTDARNSFQMKTLRAFTAVMEAKVYFGDELISVNILFGDPDNEVPQANVNALFGFFDVNIAPRNVAKNPTIIVALEAKALEYAANESFTVLQAIANVIRNEPSGVSELADILKQLLPGAICKPELTPLWQMERERTRRLATPPEPGEATYYKRVLLKSLYLSDAHFAELITKQDPDKCSAELQNQLVLTKIAEAQELIDGDHFILDEAFKKFIQDPHATELRELCKATLEEESAMTWFFEDIRNNERRLQMAKLFLDVTSKGLKATHVALQSNLANDNYGDISHKRCWIADLIALAVNASQNEYNKRLVQSNRDPENYQYPFSHITGKFERLLNNPDHFEKYSEYSVEVYAEICQEKGIDPSHPPWSVEQLGSTLLKLRLDGAVKLQRFNPLYAILESLGRTLRVTFEPIHAKSIIYDLAGGRGRLGKYDVAVLKKNGKKIIVVVVAVHDQNGDHKSKEWGARRRATLYRLQGGRTIPSEFQDALFILDGEWQAKDVRRLYRSGWNHIIRLGELEKTLREIFHV